MLVVFYDNNALGLHYVQGIQTHERYVQRKINSMEHFKLHELAFS